MKPLLRAWLKAAWHVPRPKPFDLRTNREEIIRRLVPGRSFVDFGGMWNVHGDYAFLAEEAGASQALLVDDMEATDEFEEKRKSRDSAVECRRGDLHDAKLIDELGQFDVTWCTGVLYHTPNPLLQLEHLRRMTREHLVLGTRVIPEVPGLEQACVFYPGLPEEAREAYGRAPGAAQTLLGLSTPFDFEVNPYANNWWGLTRSAVRGMLWVVGFDVVEEHSPTPYTYDVVARASSRGRAA